MTTLFVLSLRVNDAEIYRTEITNNKAAVSTVAQTLIAFYKATNTDDNVKVVMRSYHINEYTIWIDNTLFAREESKTMADKLYELLKVFCVDDVEISIRKEVEFINEIIYN